MFITPLMPNLKYKQSPVVQDIQIFDLLQWSRNEKDLKEECRSAISHYHRWKRHDPKYIGSFLVLYSSLQGRLLLRHAQNAVLLYRLVRRTRRAMFETYLQSLPVIRA